MPDPSPSVGVIEKIWDWAIKGSVPIVIAAGTVVVRHEIQISTIEDRQFTIKEQVTDNAQKLATIPPAWLRDNITDIKQLVKDMDVRIRRVEESVARINK